MTTKTLIGLLVLVSTAGCSNAAVGDIAGPGGARPESAKADGVVVPASTCGDWLGSERDRESYQAEAERLAALIADAPPGPIGLRDRAIYEADRGSAAEQAAFAFGDTRAATAWILGYLAATKRQVDEVDYALDGTTEPALDGDAIIASAHAYCVDHTDQTLTDAADHAWAARAR